MFYVLYYISRFLVSISEDYIYKLKIIVNVKIIYIYIYKIV